MRNLQPTVEEKKFGLIAWLEKTRIALPLKGVECRFGVHGDLLHVEVDQVFHQNATRALDCIYTFPLPAGAAVYRCEMHVNNRMIRAKVEEKERAREIFAQKKAEGLRAAMVEVERENLFMLSLGNVQPQDVIVARLAFFQTLERLGDSISLRVPVCPGIRYIPGKPLLRANTGVGSVDDTDHVSDASRITPPRIDALHSDAAYFFLEGTIDASVVVAASIASPSHPVLVRDLDGTPRVLLADKVAVPDRDFILRWKEPQENRVAPLAWTSATGDATHALVQLRAPQITAAQTEVEQDIYFLVDRSGSMAGVKWTKSCEALRAFIRLLGPHDRVWITFFESGFQDFAEKPLSAVALNGDALLQNIERIGTTGGTELLPALSHLLEKIAKHSSARIARILLITDGQIGNEAEVITRMRAQPELTLHAFGIDTVVNGAFLKRLAEQQRGRCALCTPNDDIAGMVANLAERLRHPVLTRLQLSSGWEPASESLPDLFAGEVVDISLRAKDASTPLALAGTLPDGTGTTIRFEPKATRDDVIGLLWARERIAALLATDHSAEAIALAKAHNLLCEGTAFIAWDDKERVPVATEAVYQPNLEPAQWDMDFCKVMPSVTYLRETPPPVSRIFSHLLSASPSLETSGRPDFKLWQKRAGLRLRGRLTRWRRVLSALDFFQSPEGESLLDLLCFWVAENPCDLDNRWAALGKLQVDVLARPDNTEQIVRAFVLRELSANKRMYDQAVTILNVWASA